MEVSPEENQTKDMDVSPPSKPSEPSEPEEAKSPQGPEFSDEKEKPSLKARVDDGYMPIKCLNTMTNDWCI